MLRESVRDVIVRGGHVKEWCGGVFFSVCGWGVVWMVMLGVYKTVVEKSGGVNERRGLFFWREYICEGCLLRVKIKMKINIRGEGSERGRVRCAGPR